MEILAGFLLAAVFIVIFVKVRVKVTFNADIKGEGWTEVRRNKKTDK